jgi:hypothetical protein
MIYNEVVQDIFSVPDDYYIVNCISADFAMNDELALEFDKRFHLKETLRQKYMDYLAKWSKEQYEGSCIVEGRVLNLITKENEWDTTTYSSMLTALVICGITCIENNIAKIAIPTINNTIEGLHMDKVSELIKDSFQECDIEILICKQKSNTEMTLQEMLGILDARAKADADEEYKKDQAEENARRTLIARIQEIKPRIQDLITAANRCKELGIEIPADTKKYGYGQGSFGFIADGFYHKVGFMSKNKCPIEYIGFLAGGACGHWDFYTNGDLTFVLHDDNKATKEANSRQMQKFLNNFELFEKAFHKWIKSLAPIKEP